MPATVRDLWEAAVRLELWQLDALAALAFVIGVGGTIYFGRAMVRAWRG